MFSVDQTSGESRLLLENTGYSNIGFGVMGFDTPVWTPDERYIVGEIDDSIVVVDPDSGRAGVVTTGISPLVRISGYRPIRVPNAMYDSWVQ